MIRACQPSEKPHGKHNEFGEVCSGTAPVVVSETNDPENIEDMLERRVRWAQNAS